MLRLGDQIHIGRQLELLVHAQGEQGGSLLQVRGQGRFFRKKFQNLVGARASNGMLVPLQIRSRGDSRCPPGADARPPLIAAPPGLTGAL